MAVTVEDNTKKNNPTRKTKMIVVSFSILLGVLIVIGAGWFIYQSTNLTYKNRSQNYPSLKDNWTSLEAKAHEWKSDSYLFGVEYENPADVKLTAKYQSPSTLGTELIITIDKAGEFTVDPIDLGFEAVISKPVRLQDLSVDVQEAINIFSQDKTVSGCLNDLKIQKQLSIESDLMGFPTWTLFIVDCPNFNQYKTAYLNAKTGGIFEITPIP
jgi:hypothetical protein